jgi:hypothetical protein
VRSSHPNLSGFQIRNPLSGQARCCPSRSWPTTLRNLVVLIVLIVHIARAPSLSAQEPKTGQAPAAPVAQPSATSTNATTGTSLRPESGSTSDNLYTNDFFGFTYEFPKGWAVEDEQTKKYVMELSKAAMSAGDPAKKAVVEEQMKRTHVLLTVHQRPYGTPVPVNPAITVMATDVSVAPGIQSGRDQLLALKMGLPQQRLDFKIIREPTDCTFGGRPFSRMDITVEAANGKTLYLSHVALVLNRYGIDFMFTAQGSDQLEVLVQTLNTLQFKPIPEPPK